MAGRYRHALIEAPVEEVREPVGNPDSHPGARFTLTPARDDTFVELGPEKAPTSLRWRVALAAARALFGASTLLAPERSCRRAAAPAASPVSSASSR